MWNCIWANAWLLLYAHKCLSPFTIHNWQNHIPSSPNDYCNPYSATPKTKEPMSQLRFIWCCFCYSLYAENDDCCIVLTEYVYIASIPLQYPLVSWTLELDIYFISLRFAKYSNVFNKHQSVTWFHSRLFGSQCITILAGSVWCLLSFGFCLFYFMHNVLVAVEYCKIQVIEPVCMANVKYMCLYLIEFVRSASLRCRSMLF